MIPAAAEPSAQSSAADLSLVETSQAPAGPSNFPRDETERRVFERLRDVFMVRHASDGGPSEAKGVADSPSAPRAFVGRPAACRSRTICSSASFGPTRRTTRCRPPPLRARGSPRAIPAHRPILPLPLARAQPADEQRWGDSALALLEDALKLLSEVKVDRSEQRLADSEAQMRDQGLFDQYWPFQELGLDSSNHWAVLDRLGRCDFDTLSKQLGADRILQCYARRFENVRRSKLALADKNGTTAYYHTTVIDLQGLNTSFLRKENRSFIKRTFQFSSKCYPETVFRIYIINCPAAFPMFWKMIRPWLDPETSIKIQVRPSLPRLRLPSLLHASPPATTTSLDHHPSTSRHPPSAPPSPCTAGAIDARGRPEDPREDGDRPRQAQALSSLARDARRDRRGGPHTVRPAVRQVTAPDREAGLHSSAPLMPSSILRLQTQRLPISVTRSSSRESTDCIALMSSTSTTKCSFFSCAE